MSSRLINHPCFLISRVEVDEDDYGSPIVEEVRTEAVCELQQIRRDEPGDAGETSDTRWNCYFPADTVLGTGDAVEVDGDVYELVGDPWNVRSPWTHTMSHVQATVRRVAGADDEEEGS